MIKTALKYDPMLVFLAPLVLVVGVVAKLALGMEPIASTAPEGGVWITKDWPIWLNHVGSLCFGLLTAFLVNQLTQNLGLLGRITNVTMVVFTMFFFTIPDGYQTALAWPFVLLQLQMLKLLEDMYDQPDRAAHLVFSISLMVGLIALFFNGGILLFILVIQGLVISGAGSIKRVLVGVLGVLLPMYLINAVLYLIEAPFLLPEWSIDLSLLSGRMVKTDVLGISMLCFLVICAFGSMIGISSSSTLRERRRWMLVIGYFVVGSLLVVNSGWAEAVYILIIPATMILTRVFLLIQNRKLANALLLVFLALVLLINS